MRFATELELELDVDLLKITIISTNKRKEAQMEVI